MGRKIVRLCKSLVPNHEEARKILKQLKKNPEVCDDCEIRLCSFSLYPYGREK